MSLPAYKDADPLWFPAGAFIAALYALLAYAGIVLTFYRCAGVPAHSMCGIWMIYLLFPAGWLIGYWGPALNALGLYVLLAIGRSAMKRWLNGTNG